MSMVVTRRRERIETQHHTRQFDWEGETNWGFGFDCDEHGNVDVAKLNPCAAANYAACLTGVVDGRKVVDKGVRSWESSYVRAAEGTCECGALVVLDGDTCGEGIDCECGRIYNSAGQELAPRSQWEERMDDDY